jgi:hypothetical protein
MLAYYGTTICALLGLRYLLVRVTVLGSRAGLISAQRIFILGTGRTSRSSSRATSPGPSA